MPTIMRRPSDRKSLPATRRISRDMRATSLRRLPGPLQPSTTIISNKPIPQLASSIDIQHGIANPMDTKIRHPFTPSITSRQLPTSNHRHSAEVLRTRTRKRPVPDIRVHGVDEFEIATPAVRPPAVEALGRDEDCCFVRFVLQAVVFPVSGSAVAAVGDLGHAAAVPVEPVDELVSGGLLVV
ncbi:unnamed protein product [Periconia digitata]|uniref:Uncharacterized protein n=1 Tax=Periconia digitata TaxID=1303443 RepID=A0A9W4XRW6_9PLEO|nr:unnamed protein product [Periconia digitata]